MFYNNQTKAEYLKRQSVTVEEWDEDFKGFSKEHGKTKESKKQRVLIDYVKEYNEKKRI